MSQETSAMVYYACFHSIVNYGIIFFGGGGGWGGGGVILLTASIFLSCTQRVVRIITGSKEN